MADINLWVRIKTVTDKTYGLLVGQSAQLNKNLEETSHSVGELDRNLKGAGNTTSNTTKSFSKMSQGLGGLVHVYATIAANLFAATAAFEALRRAARTEQLTASMQAFGTLTGVAMRSLTTDMRTAAQGALSFEEAMRAAAAGTAAGFTSSQIKDITKVATNASKVLGRDTTDSIDRLTRGLAKLEPELIDELGIMTRVDEATRNYARSVGKSTLQLTSFEKRMAFANAALEEGNRKFGLLGDSVPTNEFDILAAKIADIAKSLGGFFSNVLAPIFNFLLGNMSTLLVTLTAIGSYFAKKLIPQVGNFGETLQKNANIASETASLMIAKVRRQTAEGFLTSDASMKADMDRITASKDFIQNEFKKLGAQGSTKAKDLGGYFGKQYTTSTLAEFYKAQTKDLDELINKANTIQLRLNAIGKSPRAAAAKAEKFTKEQELVALNTQINREAKINQLILQRISFMEEETALRAQAAERAGRLSSGELISGNTTLLGADIRQASAQMKAGIVTSIAGAYGPIDNVKTAFSSTVEAMRDFREHVTSAAKDAGMLETAWGRFVIGARLKLFALNATLTATIALVSKLTATIIRAASVVGLLYVAFDLVTSAVKGIANWFYDIKVDRVEVATQSLENLKSALQEVTSQAEGFKNALQIGDVTGAINHRFNQFNEILNRTRESLALSTTQLNKLIEAREKARSWGERQALGNPADITGKQAESVQGSIDTLVDVAAGKNKKLQARVYGQILGAYANVGKLAQENLIATTDAQGRLTIAIQDGKEGTLEAAQALIAFSDNLKNMPINQAVLKLQVFFQTIKESADSTKRELQNVVNSVLPSSTSSVIAQNIDQILKASQDLIKVNNLGKVIFNKDDLEEASLEYQNLAFEISRQLGTEIISAGISTLNSSSQAAAKSIIDRFATYKKQVDDLNERINSPIATNQAKDQAKAQLAALELKPETIELLKEFLALLFDSEGVLNNLKETSQEIAQLTYDNARAQALLNARIEQTRGLAKDTIQGKVQSLRFSIEELGIQKEKLRIQKMELDQANSQDPNTPRARAAFAANAAEQSLVDAKQETARATANQLELVTQILYTNFENNEASTIALDVLSKQREIYQESLDLIKERKDYELELSKIVESRLADELAAMKFAISARKATLGDFYSNRETGSELSSRFGKEREINTQKAIQEIRALQAEIDRGIAAVGSIRGNSPVDKANRAELQDRVNRNQALLLKRQEELVYEERELLRNQWLEALDKAKEILEHQDKFVSSFHSTQEFAGEVWYQIGQTFKANIDESMGAVKSTAEIFTSALDDSVNALVDAFVQGEDVFNALKEGLRDSLQTSLGNAAKDQIKQGLMTGIGSLIPEGNGRLTNLAESLFKSEPAKQADLMVNAFKPEIDRIIAAIQGNNLSGVPNSSTDLPGNKKVLASIEGYGAETASKQTSILEAIKTGNMEYKVGNTELGTMLYSGLGSIATALFASKGNKSGAIGGSVLGLAGSIIGGMYGGTAGSVFGGQLGGLIGSKFANGGIMTSNGPINLYSKGGIANSPQMAIYGEGRKAEAYVPLPDGKSIPVTMQNSGSNVNNISINVQVDGNGNATASAADSSGSEQMGAMLGTVIANGVKQQLAQEMRPGGLLYKGRR